MVENGKNVDFLWEEVRGPMFECSAPFDKI
jgi:hypothetical protein